MSLKDKKDKKSSVNYKARLEKKLYLAQESPEPVFDLSVCNLKVIPSNVFALCRVLLKEALYLQDNNLTDLTSGGALTDLKNLRVLNISANNFKKLPSNINELESLEVLDVSKNQLIELPETIGGLQNLVCLNASYNNLKNLPNRIGNCKNMEVLTLTYNEELSALPLTLAKLHSLVELHIDTTVSYPPRDVTRRGVSEILKFLSKDLRDDEDIPSTSTNVRKSIPGHDSLQEKIELHERNKLEKQNELMRLERELMEQNQKELEIQQKLKTDKQKLLENVKNQQESLDAELVKLQKRKIDDRALLIQLCQEEEKKTNDVVFKILNVKRNLHMQYTKEWEKERIEEEKMLLSYSTQSRALERKKILVSMEELMTDEINRAQSHYQDRRMFVVRSLASEVSKQNDLLQSLIEQRVKGKAQLFDEIRREEELQKSAVASLLEKSDANSWELAKQISIIEQELAELTRLEVAKRALESECQINELSKNRIALTELLMNLLQRQTERREQLINTIRKMERMRESAKDSEMFWLRQYDKLLNSKGHEMVKFLNAVNPKLVYELYVNGVFHYLPLLREVALSENELKNLNDADLTELGITNAGDRSKILRSVNSFLESETSSQIVPSAPSIHEPSAPSIHNLEYKQPASTSYLVPDECVICLEVKPSVVFVPCGHLCCCYKCSTSVTACPLCRKTITGCHERTT